MVSLYNIPSVQSGSQLLLVMVVGVGVGVVLYRSVVCTNSVGPEEDTSASVVVVLDMDAGETIT